MIFRETADALISESYRNLFGHVVWVSFRLVGCFVSWSRLNCPGQHWGNTSTLWHTPGLSLNSFLHRSRCRSLRTIIFTIRAFTMGPINLDSRASGGSFHSLDKLSQVFGCTKTSHERSMLCHFFSLSSAIFLTYCGLSLLCELRQTPYFILSYNNVLIQSNADVCIPFIQNNQGKEM